MTIPLKTNILPPRGLEVVKSLLCNYGDYKKTGDELFIAPTTAKTHLQHAFQVSGTNNQMSLTAWLLNQNLLTVEEFTKNCKRL